VNVLFLATRFPYLPDCGDRISVSKIIGLLSEKHNVHRISFHLEKDSGDRFIVSKVREFKVMKQ